MSMNPNEKSEAYKQFFEKTAAGQEFMEELTRLIGTNHEAAEDKPELARDHVQRAKGVREVLQHIQIVTTEVKKGKLVR